MGVDKVRTKWFPKPEYDSDGLQEKINQTVNGYNSAGLEVVDVEKVMVGTKKDVYLFKLSEKDDS